MARIVGGSEDGFFARDTRFVSGYDLLINGSQPVLLNSSQVQFFSARFEFSNDGLIDEDGPIERHTISVRLDRTIAGGVHEDYDITNYAPAGPCSWPSRSRSPRTSQTSSMSRTAGASGGAHCTVAGFGHGQSSGPGTRTATSIGS